MFGDRRFSPAAPRFWNTLPEEGSLAIFKEIPENTLFSYKCTDNKQLLPYYLNHADSYTYFTVMPSFISCLSYSYTIIVVLH